MVKRIVLADGAILEVDKCDLWYYYARSNRRLGFTERPYIPDAGYTIYASPEIGYHVVEVQRGIDGRVIAHLDSPISSIVE